MFKQIPIIGFIHIGNIGRWHSIYQDQIKSIKLHKLYEKTNLIYLGVSGDDISDQVEQNEKIKIFCHDSNLSNGENNTLKEIFNFSKYNDCKIWYIHTKGAQYHEGNMNEYVENVDSWRKYLEYFIIEKHNECIEALNNYDVCGAEWHGNHFWGNFWWANSKYIRKMKNILIGNCKRKRCLAEFHFINKGNPKVKNFFYYGNKKWYQSLCKRSDYCNFKLFL